MAPSDVMATPNISSTSGSRSNGAIGSGGTIEGGGAGVSINTQGPLPAFNLVVEFFYEL